jgi:hypothetical protein
MRPLYSQLDLQCERRLRGLCPLCVCLPTGRTNCTLLDGMMTDSAACYILTSVVVKLKRHPRSPFLVLPGNM